MNRRAFVKGAGVAPFAPTGIRFCAGRRDMGVDRGSVEHLDNVGPATTRSA
jgi:hypothetical protein